MKRVGAINAEIDQSIKSIAERKHAIERELVQIKREEEAISRGIELRLRCGNGPITDFLPKIEALEVKIERDPLLILQLSNVIDQFRKIVQKSMP